MSFGKRCRYGKSGVESGNLACAIVLRIVSIKAADKQVAAESELEHIGSVVGEVTDSDGGIFRNKVCVGSGIH